MQLIEKQQQRVIVPSDMFPEAQEILKQHGIELITADDTLVLSFPFGTEK